MLFPPSKQSGWRVEGLGNTELFASTPAPLIKIMLNVQKFLSTRSLEDLKNEFDIKIHDYPDLVVLNYGLKSPRFNSICDECRGLILEKGTWNVVSRAFDRFYNIDEGVIGKTFPWEKADYYEKLDGTLISVYCYKSKWNVATRSMAFAEGTIMMGTTTFHDLFMQAVKETKVFEYIATSNDKITWVFELTSPENRIVTRYSDTKATLLAARHNSEIGGEYGSALLDEWAARMWVARPKKYPFNTIEAVAESAKSLDALDEGFVAVWETQPAYIRVKCKNPKYVAIAHLRDNGKVSAKRLLTLVMSGEASEFLSYFPEYKQYYDFVENEWNNLLNTIKTVWEETKNIQNQKEFALTIQSKTKSGLALGCLFSIKKGRTFKEATTFDSLTRLYKNLDLKRKFEKHFNLQIEDDEEE